MTASVEMTLDYYVRHWAAERAECIALREGERSITYRELDEATKAVASLLVREGVKRGDRIAWIGQNSALYFVLFYGAARAGVVMVPIGWRLSPAEWASIIEDCDARLVFAGPGFDDLSAQVEGELSRPRAIFGAADTWARIESACEEAIMPAAADEPILQLYTSGTTGKPKGVVLANRNLFELHRYSEGLDLPYLQWDENEAVLVAMPCAHIGGTGIGVAALRSGLTSVVLAEFTPDGVFDAVEQHCVTRFFMVPAALQILLAHPRCAQVDYSRLKYVLYGAAPMPLELLRQSIKTFGAQFIQAYGMTETTGTICLLPPEDHDPEGNKRMRSAGKPLPGVEIKIMGADDSPLPAGAVGEILARSPSNMLGYWRRPEATASTMTTDGWIRTGDAGYLDEDGYLYIHDRLKDMIISGGENIYPAEVENAIFGHPAVQEVAVIGVPDQKWGEAVKAICVPKPGMTIDAADILAWARARIAAFKCPRSVDVVAALPRNASGKVLRREVRAPYWEGYERNVN